LTDLNEGRLDLPRSPARFIAFGVSALLLFTLLGCDTLIHYRVRRVVRGPHPRSLSQGAREEKLPLLLGEGGGEGAPRQAAPSAPQVNKA